ncbi:Cadmium-transporting ATPase [bioreactor metagenome]|uniref:Cadmium-transporting ATPase n=1 Tax=bioreactor metagenome TaxID=1076179 RepID=A0A644TQX4_9ZZZZ|nr:heavy metal translocating P-type ATPase [Negativicutes bacterium]
MTYFQVTGITCLDCAAKFERNVAALPGVTSAALNTMTGKLVVEGSIDIKVIQQLGREENYLIAAGGEAEEEKQDNQPNWEMRRAIISGVALAIAYGMEKTGSAELFFIPIYVAAMILGGWGNFRKTIHALPRGNFNMSVLMSIAIVGAVAIGHYEEGATVAFLYAISEMLEAWTMERARRSIRQLMDIAPKTATIRENGHEVEVPVEKVSVGNIILIRPGEKLAMDGVIIKGQSAINQAAITGEALPIEKSLGDEVFAGTLNTYGALEVEVTKLVKDTTITKIINMVEEAQSRRAPSQAFVEKFAAIYTPVVIALAIGIIIIPPAFLGYEWAPWIYRGLTLLVVACPCALVISTPVAIVSAISAAARQGVLIKGGVYLEEMGSVTAVAFDKTGTLTSGRPVVADVVTLGKNIENDLLILAASIESQSEHPLATAIVKVAQEKELELLSVGHFKAVPGLGAQGVIQGRMVYIGNTRLFDQLNIETASVEQEILTLQAEGKTVMIVSAGGELLGLIAVADQVREATPQVIHQLKQVGISHTIMLTGDNYAIAKAVALQAGIDKFRAELLPQDKVAAIEKLLGDYGKTAMVGDGINDAPALAIASVGVAMGGAGTDTALEVADIALMADDLTKLPFTIRLSRKALRIIRQNISFSLLIKAVAVLAVFPGWLTLWLAILADMGATLLVTLNSLRLLRVDKE